MPTGNAHARGRAATKSACAEPKCTSGEMQQHVRRLSRGETRRRADRRAAAARPGANTRVETRDLLLRADRAAPRRPRRCRPAMRSSSRSFCDAARLQLGRAPHRRLLVVHAVAQAAQQPGAASDQRSVRWAGQRTSENRGESSRLAILIGAAVGVLLHGQRDRVPAIDQRADGVGEGLDVLLLLEDEQDLHASGALVRRSPCGGRSLSCEPALAPRGDRAAGATS